MGTVETTDATGGYPVASKWAGGPGVHSGASIPQAPIGDKEAAGRLFAHLWRGGTWSYFWTPTDKESLWFPVGRAPGVPAAWLNQNCYFGVHPCGARYGKDERSKIATITAVNCLFSEFDAKDFPDGKTAILARLNELPIFPSAVFDSGGGYHCYWFLRETLTVNDGNRADMIALQAAWVTFTGGDKAAKDLARVLRVPGTRNMKPEYGPNFPTVTLVQWTGTLYDLGDFETLTAGLVTVKAPGTNGATHFQPSTWGGSDLETVAAALDYVNPWAIDYAEWVSVLMAIHAEFGMTGLSMAAAWADGKDGEVESKFLSFKPSGNGSGRVTLGTVFALAKQFGWQRPQAARPAGYQAPVIGEPAPAGAPQIDLILHTDMGNSRRFALRHADRAAYVTGWGWMIWDGKRWESDETGAAARMARTTVKDLWQDAQEAAQEAARAIRDMQAAQDRGDEAALDRAKTHKAESERRSKDLLAWALKSQGSQRLDAMLKLATSEPEIAARVADFDADPWALNVQNGILDLRTGNLRAHDPGARLTKIAGAAYDPGATCPTWLGFLDRVFAHDQTLIDFVQRAAGYSLTADVREQCLFFLYGVGANGKSVFTGALQDVTGSYAMKTRAETLMVKHGDSISEEVAQMPGARFLLAAELEENRRLNESLVKDLTGGDRQRARLLYQRSFEFAPTAKPWLYGNHRPTIRGTDLGIWRRVALIPFGVTIPESERDKNLSGKLRAELPGILAWAVRGCLAWQSAGLGIPDVVRAATADYRHEQDSIGLFLAERCILAPEATVTAGELHGAYLRWAEISHERGISQRAFSQDLATNHGFVTEKDRKPGTGRSYYLGLGLLENAGL